MPDTVNQFVAGRAEYPNVFPRRFATVLELHPVLGFQYLAGRQVLFRSTAHLAIPAREFLNEVSMGRRTPNPIMVRLRDPP